MTTSLTGITENDDRDTPDLVAVNKGSGASAVPALIAAILSVKNCNIVNEFRVLFSLQYLVFMCICVLFWFGVRFVIPQLKASSLLSNVPELTLKCV